jgi:hypothetical protein
MRTQQQLPNLSNYSAEAIVDECGEDQEELRKLDRLTKFLKAGLKARLEDRHIVDSLTRVVTGEKYLATISTEHVTVVDSAQLRTLLTEEQISSCTKIQTREVIRFTKLPPKE